MTQDFKQSHEESRKEVQKVAGSGFLAKAKGGGVVEGPVATPVSEEERLEVLA
eukprot:CAMPEP_0180514138 /NCGR_PEP_ID=MMETSP1036_2-20121128/52558_1 /TAXON_ID=632150 /ORGANISM="Azadinium spinosum, Strain 3D9" /LENGTH=52 /DNA_ID=CAMNT_0022525517 /DNA_START=109 /DNA_END=263 /DNA_ORIENTATION=+